MDNVYISGVFNIICGRLYVGKKEYNTLRRREQQNEQERPNIYTHQP